MHCSGAGVYVWLPRVTLALVMIIGVYVLTSGSEEGRLMQQLSAHRPGLLPWFEPP